MGGQSTWIHRTGIEFRACRIVDEGPGHPSTKSVYEGSHI